MGCVQTSKKRYQQGAFKEIELTLLKMMFDDIASRSPIGTMTKENFYIFFHINGLWGHEIFTRFDKNKNGGLQFEEFRSGVEELVKGSFRKKVKALFDFYDIDRSGSISHAELLKMLYSYPKEELKEMFKDKKFVDAMGKHDKEYMLKEENMNKPILEVVEQLQDESAHIRRRRNSEHIDDRVQVLTPQPVHGVEANGAPSFGNFAMKQMGKFTRNAPAPLGVLTGGQRGTMNGAAGKQGKSPLRAPLLRGGSSVVGAEAALRNKKINVSSNISMLVRRYATFLFEEEHLNIHTDKLNVDQFSKLIEGHEKIFASYFEGFHNYIWEVESSDNIPEFIVNTSWVQDNCTEIWEKEGIQESRYLRFYKNTIFVLKKSTSHIPEEIKNMEGLFVEEHNLEKRHLYGFIIKHRDGVYPEKAYMFKDKEAQAEWMRHLKFFKKISMLEKYIFDQKIGTGNFSVVYRGTERESNQPVAIKSIQKFKLSVAEREVIQHECGILERCHHPSIVQFVQKSETKTHIYIVTELLNEGDLDEYVKEKTFLDEYEASIIMKQLIEAMVYLNNSLGLIHRDLKPENIMIRKRKDRDRIEKVKLIDFGFAVYKNALKSLGAREKYVGTPNFVAPEVLQLQEFDQTVDNFSLGVIMYYMLSGTLPFNNIIHEEINRLTVECKISMDNAHWSNISEAAKQLVQGLITFKEQRMSLTDALNHPWITQFKDLKALIGRNKRSRYI